jgi:hypothetical protein
MQEIIENGTLATDALEARRLPPAALPRLQMLQARLQGATDVAQAAINAHTTVRAQYTEALSTWCLAAGIEIPQWEHEAEIDWTTGEVRFIPRR